MATEPSEADINAMIERGNTYGLCPEDDCDHKQWTSPEDPDSSFSDLLDHIRSVHPDDDMTPAIMWPKIKFREEQ